MTWQAYRVVWRLQAPLHVGRGKVGNVQLTRPYVTGRVLWGALTERLTRDGQEGIKPAVGLELYDGFGQDVHAHLAFSYLYLALNNPDNGDYQIHWPWGGQSDCASPPPAGPFVPRSVAETGGIEGGPTYRARFMSSYASTALDYPQHSAQEGSLHEVEFLSPHTLDKGEPVYLVGTLLAADAAPQGWQGALERLQIGGERGYGWGRLELKSQCQLNHPPTLFGYSLALEGQRPIVTVPANEPLLAHTQAVNLQANGDVEPLVGRAWGQRGAGQKVEHIGVYYAPGATVNAEAHFTIGHFGLWQEVGSDATA